MLNAFKAVRSFARRLQRKQEDKRYVVRTGVSQEVLDAAERLMKEYQDVLDYLKDR